MDDLNNALFFDGRTISFMRNLLWRGPRGVSVMTALEKKLLENYEELRALDGELNGGLLSLLESTKEYVAIPDLIPFLLEARRLDLLDDAQTTLRIAVEDKRQFTAEQLASLLGEAEFTPMFWNIYVFGDAVEENRYERDERRLNRPSIDIDRLREFH